MDFRSRRRGQNNAYRRRRVCRVTTTYRRSHGKGPACTARLFCVKSHGCEICLTVVPHTRTSCDIDVGRRRERRLRQCAYINVDSTIPGIKRERTSDFPPRAHAAFPDNRTSSFRDRAVVRGIYIGQSSSCQCLTDGRTDGETSAGKCTTTMATKT